MFVGKRTAGQSNAVAGVRLLLLRTLLRMANLAPPQTRVETQITVLQGVVAVQPQPLRKELDMDNLVPLLKTLAAKPTRAPSNATIPALPPLRPTLQLAHLLKILAV